MSSSEGSKKIFHCADVHLGAPSRNIPNLFEEQLRAIDRLSSDAVKEKVSAVAIAGDLFDSPHVTAAVINAFRDLIARYGALQYVVVSGTHGHDSFENEKSIYRRSVFKTFPDNFHLLDAGGAGHVVVDGIAFYSTSHSLTGPLAADRHVLVFHGTAEEVQEFIAKSPVKRFDYMALGHFHYFDEFQINTSTAAYSGTPLAFEWPKGQTGINESTFAEVVFDSASSRVVKRDSSDVRFVRALVSCPDQFDGIEKALTRKTWLAIRGNPQLKEQAVTRFGGRVNSFVYTALEIKDMPEMLITAIDEIIQRQDNQNIPWEEVREAAVRLLSGEEGKDFLKPDRYIGNLSGVE